MIIEIRVQINWTKHEMMRSNPATIAIMIERRFHVFQTEEIFSPVESIDKVTEHCLRDEFQKKGSLHIHRFYWEENIPKLDQAK